MQAKQDAIARDKAAIESARLAKLAQLETVRAACKERNITVGFPMYTELRRTAALPFMHEVTILVKPGGSLVKLCAVAPCLSWFLHT